MYYQWESPNYVFYALVSCENKRIWTIHIGSKAKPVCITFNVYKNEPEAILQNLSFDSTCASNKPMPRGIGTREMLNSAIIFIAKRFKWVPFTKITFYAPFEYFSPRLKTLAGELWTITLTDEDSIRVSEIDADAFPEMDWKPLERRRPRLYGGLIKVRRVRRMDLGEGIDI
jgi:hypothetical protein